MMEVVVKSLMMTMMMKMTAEVMMMMMIEVVAQLLLMTTTMMMIAKAMNHSSYSQTGPGWISSIERGTQELGRVRHTLPNSNNTGAEAHNLAK